MKNNKGYDFVKAIVIDEGDSGYGIFASNESGEEKLYASVSSDKEYVIALSDKINRGRVSFCQLDEIIEDLMY